MIGPCNKKQSHPHSFRLDLVYSGCLFFAVLLFPLSGIAGEIDSSTAGLTHTEFINNSLERLAEEVVIDIPPAAGQVTQFIVEDDEVDYSWVRVAFAGVLSSPAETSYTINCRVTRLDYSLVRKTRRRFLGQMWVKRELRVGMTVIYPAALKTAGAAEVDFARAYGGWFRARDLERFGTGEFSSLAAPPATDFVSRWAAPIAVGTGLGLLTYLFFSVR